MTSPTRLRDVLVGIEADWSRWMGKADGCPACVANVEAPQDAAGVPGGYACSYRCADCGHAWTTSWWDEA